MNNSVIEKAKKFVEDWECQRSSPEPAVTINIIKELLKMIEDSVKTVKLPQRYSQKNCTKDSHYYQLAEVLFNSANHVKKTYERYLENPEAVEIILQNNAHELCKLVEKDKKSIQEVIDVLEWVIKDNFWKLNILSAMKFREQYNNLKIQSCVVEDPDPEMTNKLIGIFRALTSNPSYNPHEGARAKFIEAGKKVKEFFGSRDLDPNQGVEYLLKCLSKNFIEKGQIVHPGNLCSDYTWEVIMPQYLAEIGLD